MSVVAEKINQELKQHQINAEDWDYKEDIEKLHLSGQSKSKLWICQCQPRPVHVRVAIKRFRARCLDCNQLFKPEQRREPGKKSSDHLGKQSTNTIPTGTGFKYKRSNSNKKQQICKGVEQCKG